MEFVAWPFPKLKPEVEWDEFTATWSISCGSPTPRVITADWRADTVIEAGEQTGHAVCLLFRGGNGWEPLLSDGEHTVRVGPSFGCEDAVCLCDPSPFRALAFHADGSAVGRLPSCCLTSSSSEDSPRGSFCGLPRLLRPQLRRAPATNDSVVANPAASAGQAAC